MLDVFNQDAFTLIRLTQWINDRQYVPGQIGQAGIFGVDGIDVTVVAIEKRTNDLALVGLTPRGGPGETIALAPDNLLYFPVPHFQRDDAVMADEVQGRRAFGTESELDTIMNRLDRKVSRHLIDFDNTIEHQRVGAIKGIITDKFGNAYLNLYTTFGISAPTPVAFPFSTAVASTTALTGVISAKARDLRLQIEDAVDAPYDSVFAWCGKTWWETLIELPEVRGTYLNQIAAAELRGARGIEASDQLYYGGITWQRYRTGRKAIAANAASPYIGDTEARFVLKGVPGLFQTVFAPADYNETVNTQGLPRYMKMWPRDDDKGMRVQVQTNPISYCTRPETLFSGTMA